MTATDFWIGLGFFAQALFALRFGVQWLASERAGHSVIPPLFWYISLPAGLMLFAYVVWRRDPVFITSEGLCVLVFIRNILLLHRRKL